MLPYLTRAQHRKAFSSSKFYCSINPSLGFSAQLFIQDTASKKYLTGKKLAAAFPYIATVNSLGYRPGNIWARLAQDRIVLNRSTMGCREQLGYEAYRIMETLQRNCAKISARAVATTAVTMGGVYKPSVSGLLLQLGGVYGHQRLPTKHVVELLDLYVGIPYVLLMRGKAEEQRARTILPASRHKTFKRQGNNLIYQVPSSEWLKVPVIVTSLLGYLARMALNPRLSYAQQGGPVDGELVRKTINTFDYVAAEKIMAEDILPVIGSVGGMTNPFRAPSRYNWLMYLLNKGIRCISTPRYAGSKGTVLFPRRTGIVSFMRNTTKAMFDKEKALLEIKAATRANS